MLNYKKIIAIIPARGGSKGIPKKNIKFLIGKPLIAYTIEAALKSKYLDRTIVFTEDKEIAEISKKYRAEIINRPVKLAKDNTPTSDVILHVLSVLKREDYNPDIIVLLQPTSPLRDVKDIDSAIRLFFNKNGDSLISVSLSKELPFWTHKIDKRGFIKPLLGFKNYYKRRQELPKTYMENGAICLTTPENIYKYNEFYTKKTLPYIMPFKNSIDIDEPLDFYFAEFLLKNEKK